MRGDPLTFRALQERCETNPSLLNTRIKELRAAGLVEHLKEMPQHRADIYHLAREIRTDSAELLRLTEVAELLGFATIAKGDILLTPLGETYAEASILTRKEIFASRIRRLPLFRWLLEQLKAAPDRSMDLADARGAFEQEFPPEEAERQLDSAINWGRYAEVLAYDANNHTIYLEQGSAA